MNNNNLLEIMKSKYLNDNTNDLYFKNILDLFKEMSNKSSLKPNDKLVELNINNLNELLVSENL